MVKYKHIYYINPYYLLISHTKITKLITHIQFINTYEQQTKGRETKEMTFYYYSLGMILNMYELSKINKMKTKINLHIYDSLSLSKYLSIYLSLAQEH